MFLTYIESSFFLSAGCRSLRQVISMLRFITVHRPTFIPNKQFSSHTHKCPFSWQTSPLIGSWHSPRRDVTRVEWNRSNLTALDSSGHLKHSIVIDHKPASSTQIVSSLRTRSYSNRDHNEVLSRPGRTREL